MAGKRKSYHRSLNRRHPGMGSNGEDTPKRKGMGFGGPLALCALVALALSGLGKK